MKTNKLIIISTIILIVSITLLIFKIYKDNKIEMTAISAVVVKVHEKGLDIMTLPNEETSNIPELSVDSSQIGLCRLDFTEEGDIGFKQGQEIVFYFHGMYLDSLPGQVTRT